MVLNEELVEAATKAAHEAKDGTWPPLWDGRETAGVEVRVEGDKA